MDCHSESSMKSLPPASEKIFIGICEESDGRSIKKILKIRFKHAKLLITMSVSLLINNLKMNTGPETVISGFNTKGLAIYYCPKVMLASGPLCNKEGIIILRST